MGPLLVPGSCCSHVDLEACFKFSWMRSQVVRGAAAAAAFLGSLRFWGVPTQSSERDPAKKKSAIEDLAGRLADTGGPGFGARFAENRCLGNVNPGLSRTPG